MPTTVGILTLISRINDWLSRFKPEISIDFGYFSIYEQFKFHAKLSEHEKMFYNDLCRFAILLTGENHRGIQTCPTLYEPHHEKICFFAYAQKLAPVLKFRT